MNYIVIEAQTTEDTTATIVNTYTDRAKAESKFHSILAAAADSSVEKHGAVLMTEECITLRNECYTHVEEAE